MFKPASVQALWTAIQTLHLISARLKVPVKFSGLDLFVEWTIIIPLIFPPELGTIN